MGNLKARVSYELKKGTHGILTMAFLYCAIRLGVPTFMQYVRESREAQSWIETVAWVESVDPNCTQNRGGWSCNVRAAYRYSFADREHRGTRVGVANGADRSNEWNLLWYERLRGAIERNEPVNVYVDPQDPDRSLLDPDYEGSDKYGVFLILLLVIVRGVLRIAAWVRAITAVIRRKTSWLMGRFNHGDRSL